MVKAMKFILYRSLGDIDTAVKKHELVGVEIGRSIDEVANALIKAAADELAALPEYQHCKTAAYAPEPIKRFLSASQSLMKKTRHLTKCLLLRNSFLKLS